MWKITHFSNAMDLPPLGQHPIMEREWEIDRYVGHRLQKQAKYSKNNYKHNGGLMDPHCHGWCNSHCASYWLSRCTCLSTWQVSDFMCVCVCVCVHMCGQVFKLHMMHTVLCVKVISVPMDNLIVKNGWRPFLYTKHLFLSTWMFRVKERPNHIVDSWQILDCHSIGISWEKSGVTKA